PYVRCCERTAVNHRLLLDSEESGQKTSGAAFGATGADTSKVGAARSRTSKARRAAYSVARAPIVATSATVHRQVGQYEDENVGVQAAHQTEMVGEGGIRTISHMKYSSKLKQEEKAEKLKRKTDDANVEALYQKHLSENPEAATNPLSRWMQRREIKKEYAAARAAAMKTGGTGAAASAASGAKTAAETEKKAGGLFAGVKGFIDRNSGTMKVVLVVIFVIVFLVTQLQSCGMMISGVLSYVDAATWPADDDEITKAEKYYTKLEAQLQKKINQTESAHSGSDEYSYNIGEIGHDSTALISYLSAKYGAFTFNEVKSELDAIFALQYNLATDTGTETRTVTKTVQAGEYIGEVVTSGYCSCSICCGQWAGSATASGVYPTASHTLAVDASNPIVPIGTQIIMNGTLYTVEDTGSLADYGVDFDVYYDDHSSALAHGHQTWEAYYAGGDGEEIEVTTTETVDVCYVSLETTSFESILASRMSDEESEIYDVYMQTYGGRIYFGSPVDFNWHYYVSGEYGYRCEGTRVTESDSLEITVPSGTEVLAVMDGKVKSVSNGKVKLTDGNGSVITLGGLSSISVSAGDTVEMGETIAEVGSSGVLTITFTYKGSSLNPYFYLDTGESELYENTGSATRKAALLIAKAYQYLGVPYVWGGYSPSGFDCSGFVSYCINNCGAGWNYGRLTANGLLDACTVVSSSEAQPGDLIFFQGTYNTSGASHVGIYLGNGQMIHCGSPVQVTSITSSYWQSHFYCFGRLS
ncbi:MAG: NlpC/P60 family protein, partial [Clostridiales bacterium]|nr:NlpC/P60 family protein [Clostridiales bacterium]